MDIYQTQKNINSKRTFILFLELLKKNYSSEQKEWENLDIPNFIEGLSGYLNDSESEDINWLLLSEALLAARVYE